MGVFRVFPLVWGIYIYLEDLLKSLILIAFVDS
jgi:hypothetical protein